MSENETTETIEDHESARAGADTGRRRIRLFFVAALVALAAAAALLVATSGPIAARHPEPVCMVFGQGPVNNGKAVIAAGVAMDVPEEGIVAGLTAAMTETHLLNLGNPNVPDSLSVANDGLAGDHQSLGILQQTAAWGTADERMSPATSAQRFYTAMFDLTGWESMPAGELAALVQRSAWPASYVGREPAARQFYRDHITAVRVSRCAASHADTGAALVGAHS